MPTTESPSAEIYYETFGDAADPTLLLVNGLGSQMIGWDERFCGQLAERGLQVVRFDNRDTGLSSKTDAPLPDVLAMMTAYAQGEPVGEVPYGLTDMGDDAFAVLDAVGAEQAHIAGMSMGGMIVQRMAIARPDRVASLTSIMSTTGAADRGGSTPEAGATLVTPAPEDRDGYIEHTVTTRRIIGGAHVDDDYWRAYAGVAYDRCFHPIGAGFQLAAVASDGDRTAELGELDVPTLVIHGAMDPLILPDGGHATAEAIPGAELLVLDEMGHDVPEPLWGELIDALCGVIERATGR